MKSSGVSDQQAQFDERADKHDGRVLASDTVTTILRGTLPHAGYSAMCGCIVGWFMGECS